MNSGKSYHKISCNMTPDGTVWLIYLIIKTITAVREPEWWKLYHMKYGSKEMKTLLSPFLYRQLLREPKLSFILHEALKQSIPHFCKKIAVSSALCRIRGIHPSKPLFRHTLDSKPAALLLALTTATLVKHISEACATGRLRRCACDSRMSSPFRPLSGYRWTMCSNSTGSHNVNYAKALSRKLIDNQYRCCPFRQTRRIILHNIAVGRRVVSTNVKCGQPDKTGRGICVARASEWITIQRRLRISYIRSMGQTRGNDIELTTKCQGIMKSDSRLRGARRPQLVYIDYTAPLQIV
ncbi:hypothetical protein V3C99_018918 [Haemonchus contortus]|uniref:Protein Wnt n=1 Tax=Haemonchus contortus TaxID=6289 RepID=A0A7I4Z0S7_HAECO